MTVNEVQEIVQLQAHDNLALVNDHEITLRNALIAPQKIKVILRDVKKGKLKDNEVEVWLVGREHSGEGYRIVMRERDCQFGLASTGFPHDKHLILTGWYGSLKSAFLSM